MAPRKKQKTEEKKPPAGESPKSTGPTTRSKSPAAIPERKTRGGASSSKPKVKHGWGDPDPEKIMAKNRADERERKKRLAEMAAAAEEQNPEDDGKSGGDGEDGKAKSGDDATAKSGDVVEEAETEEGQAAAGSSKGKGKVIDEGGVEVKKKKKSSKGKRILIRHCKDSGPLFIAKAAEFKAALETGPGCKVKIDHKISLGSFEVREVGGAAIIQLLEMVEPYQDLVELDVETVVAAAIAH